MERKYTFNEAADLYDEVRPTYPKEVINWITKKTGVCIHDPLLEIAPGTGQATMRFAEEGYTIQAVELGDNLARLLLRNCEGLHVTVDVSPFEEWKSKDNKIYKMMYCATAFHWLDKKTRYQKCASHLTEDGYLVIMWNNAVGTDNPVINQAYNELFRLYPGRVFSTKAKNIEALQDQREILQKDIEDSGKFTLENYLEFPWSLTQTRERTVKGFYTQSSYLSLDKEIKENLTNTLDSLFSELEDNLDSDFVTTVFVCKKTSKKE